MTRNNTDLQTMLKMYAKVGIKVMETIDEDHPFEALISLEIFLPKGDTRSLWMHFNMDTEELVYVEAYR